VRRRIARALAVAIVALGMCAAHESVRADSPADLDVAPPSNATVEQPRPFGYVVGDLLAQRVLLELNGHAFEPAMSPPAERVSAWLERRPARLASAPDGRQWLTVEYQIINAPQALTRVQIPAWQLKSKAGTDALRIGGWPISIAPLALGPGDLDALRPDRSTPIIATEPIQRRIVIGSCALTATLAVWLGWWLWRNRRASAAQPFASALREIRKVGEASPEAWQALHRAFDRTAGHVTLGATLPSLFQRAPQLAPMRASIEQFFEQSSERFFGAGLPRDALSVRALCTQLRRIEKSNER
jgi:mxaA protein